MSRLKILFIIDRLGCGGKERQFSELVRGVAASRSMVAEEIAAVVMAERDHFDDVIERGGIRLFRLRRWWRWDPFLTLRFRRLLAQLQPEVLYSFSEMATFYAAIARSSARTKLVDGSVRNAYPLKTLKEWILCWANFRAADLIVANSKAGLAAKQAPPEKSRVLYNGFDFKRLQHLEDRNTVRHSLQIRTRHAVGMVAGFSRYKDWDAFFEAARLVRAQRDDVSFVAVGGGAFLETQRRKYEGQPGVIFTGPRTDVERVLGALDIGVLCAHPNAPQEGFPNVVIEYMAAGLPVVAAATGGVAELVLDGQTGFLVEPGNARAVAEKTCGLLDHPDLAKTMGARGRERIRQEFSLERAVEQVMDICQELRGRV